MCYTLIIRDLKNLGYFSRVICQQLNVNKAVYSKFMLTFLNIERDPNTQAIYPGIRNTQGFARNSAKTRQLLRVIQVIKTQGPT